MTGYVTLWFPSLCVGTPQKQHRSTEHTVTAYTCLSHVTTANTCRMFFALSLTPQFLLSVLPLCLTNSQSVCILCKIKLLIPVMSPLYRLAAFSDNIEYSHIKVLCSSSQALGRASAHRRTCAVAQVNAQEACMMPHQLTSVHVSFQFTH